MVLRPAAKGFGKVKRDGELLHAGPIARLSIVVATAARAGSCALPWSRASPESEDAQSSVMVATTY